MSRALMLLTAATLAVSLGACRKEEQTRPLAYEPGVYKGEQTPALSQATVRQLQDRGGLQK